ncbi:MAG: site-specific DNA-methyltransferase [Caldilineaceae bacterium]
MRLIYIDPPFDSGADYVRQVRLRGDAAAKVNGQAYSLGEQVQYTDIWANDNYLQFIYERLPLMRELLAEDGTMWLHCDHRKVHHLRMLLEEVFGPDNYLNTIAWRSQVARGAKVNAFYFPYSTHSIEIFAKNRSAPPLWHPPKRLVHFSADEAAQQYMQDELGFFRTSDPGSYSFARLITLHEEGRIYAPYGGEVVVDYENERIYGSNGGSIAIKYYLTARPDGSYSTEHAIDNLWDDIPGLATTPAEEVGYPTQKTEALLERIISVSTNPGDLVLDCFMGSGTTLAVAQKLGRRWIGCDINYGSIQTVGRRLQRIVMEQLSMPFTPAAGKAVSDNTDRDHGTFAVYRINGYDLPKDEQARPSAETLTGDAASQAALVQLAAETVGVRRTRSDPFFDGLLGERLVKFADLRRPLLVADLETITAELTIRHDDLRDVVVICLGNELATIEWVERWNRHRNGIDATAQDATEKVQAKFKLGARMDSITWRSSRLQSDPRYGHFFVHQPAQAQVTVQRSPTDQRMMQIRIDDFISPTIVHRLRQQSRVEPAFIDDWRAMVDSVAIDPAYDGKCFRAKVVDVPHKRNDTVSGEYLIAVPTTDMTTLSVTTVAVKITDMLGEEVLITKRIDE